MIKQFTHWLAMGGYSNYIWSAYGLALIILVLHRLGVYWHHRSICKKLQQWFMDNK